ncbi:hypothetical protein GCM10022198_25870 [Klugiella xanthotipulae]|nr:PH domain-containing protein [Klugiella xanthotipulae]
MSDYPARTEPRAIQKGLHLPDTEWRRVSPRYITVELVNSIVTGIVCAVVALLPVLLEMGWGPVWQWVPVVSVAVISVVTIVLVPRRARAIGYQLREDDLLFRRGIFYQRIVAVPYGRMQLVDTKRGPLARALGLAELKFVTAAAATGLTLPGLAYADATELRDHLVAVAETRRSGL